METLGEARAFAPGIDVAGGLAPDAWAGTSPVRAVRLMETLDPSTDHPVARDLLRRVVLAGIAPPADVGDDFSRARIRAAQALASPAEYERFAARNPAAMAPRLRADAAVGAGDLDAACEVSDSVLDGRGDTDWVRLRAACHAARGETAAAELAREILRDRGEATELDMPGPRTPFWSQVAALDAAALDDFMAELAQPQVDDSALAGASPLDPLPVEPSPLDIARDYDLNDALDDPSPQGTARLYQLGKAGDAAAVSAFVRRAVASGFDADTMLDRVPAVLDPTDMAQADLPLFARHAVARSDIALIQALFEATDNDILRQRLALASDALGGGFIARPLGEGLEADLAAGTPTALSDVLIALALGAELSDTADALLDQADLDARVDTNWIAVDQAVDRGARAEILLRLAGKLPTGETAQAQGWTLYRTLRALNKAGGGGGGFPDAARRLAAHEFLRGL